MPELSYAGRRVLAHLPVWTEDEAALIEAEGGPEHSVRSYTLEDLTDRLLKDGATPDMDAPKVGEILAELAAVGLCETETRVVPGAAEDEPATEVAAWRMTQLGLEVLTDPTPPEEQTPGPAFIDLQPAQIESSATTEVQAR
jgi:hypothetical protein